MSLIDYNRLHIHLNIIIIYIIIKQKVEETRNHFQINQRNCKWKYSTYGDQFINHMVAINRGNTTESKGCETNGSNP